MLIIPGLLFWAFILSSPIWVVPLMRSLFTPRDPSRQRPGFELLPRSDDDAPR